MIKLLSVGSSVSLFLAAIGLIGIIGLQLNQRLKEVSIRKVMGASRTNLYTIFSQRFMVVVCIGLTIGLLISYILIKDWLNNYPYHVNFDVFVISSTIMVTLIIAFFAIMIQIARVVSSNPVKFLRNE